MDIFKDLVKNYEQNIAKGQLYHKNGRTALAIQYFNDALIDL